MFTLNCKGRLIKIEEPLVMGILNTTPDSFHAASRTKSVDDAIEKAKQMLDAGATILDIGAQSTRPGSENVGADTELERIIPVIEAISKAFPEAIISVDTFIAKVAKAAVMAGASIVNDISGGLFDENMLTTVAELKTPFICMHVRGNANTMHQITPSSNCTLEVLDYFIERIAACNKAGIVDIIVDPGFGFGKSMDENFQLLKNLQVFTQLKKPILLGVSRKSMIYKTLNGTAENALNGSTVLHTIGLLNGASILRVHDVKEAREAIILTQQLKQ
ncbi:MAG: dihydropteroate synthase [Bacteroidetes bacterium]|nr:dihydropteroate synthase [Bacteroidota bacterium]